MKSLLVVLLAAGLAGLVERGFAAEPDSSVTPRRPVATAPS